jgi:hypothetical protein
MSKYSELKKLFFGETVEKDVQEIYRRTFDTDAGRQVLAHMLVELHFFDELVSEEEVALSNYARKLLNRLGLRAEHIPEIVTQIISIKLEGGTNEKIV